MPPTFCKKPSTFVDEVEIERLRSPAKNLGDIMWNFRPSSKQDYNGQSLHFIQIYPISWLSVNAIGAAAEYESKRMYQTSLSVREGWKKLFFYIGHISIASTVVTHQIPANIIWEHVRATIIMKTFRLLWEYTKHAINYSQYKNNVGSFLIESKLIRKNGGKKKQQQIWFNSCMANMLLM